MVLNTSGNLTVCWKYSPDDCADGYYITSHPLNSPSASPLWINQSSPGARWVNLSICVDLGTFTPGQTYDVGVISMKGNARSQRTNVIHTTGKRNKNNVDVALDHTGHCIDYIYIIYIFLVFLSLCADPLPVQVAIPLSVGTNSAMLYIQHPQLGLIDGVKVCVCLGLCDTLCEGLCGHTCTWYSLPAGLQFITVSNLNPGSEYQLVVYSTSQGQLGPPYYTHPIRTSELKYLRPY